MSLVDPRSSLRRCRNSCRDHVGETARADDDVLVLNVVHDPRSLRMGIKALESCKGRVGQGKEKWANCRKQPKDQNLTILKSWSFFAS